MSCAGSCQEQLSKNDVDKCISNVGQMMASDLCKKKFKTFLVDRNLNDAIYTFDFVCQCDAILEQLEKGMLTRSHRKREFLHKALEHLLYLAEEVNFYEIQMKQLNEVLKEQNEEIISEIVKKAKQSALFLLEEEHGHFSEILRKEYCSCQR